MIAAMATGDPISMSVWLVHLSVNVIGALIFLLLMKSFSKIVKITADKVAFSPKLMLIITAVFYLIPLSIILLHALGEF